MVQLVIERHGEKCTNKWKDTIVYCIENCPHTPWPFLKISRTFTVFLSHTVITFLCHLCTCKKALSLFFEEVANSLAQPHKWLFIMHNSLHLLTLPIAYHGSKLHLKGHILHLKFESAQVHFSTSRTCVTWLEYCHTGIIVINSIATFNKNPKK